MRKTNKPKPFIEKKNTIPSYKAQIERNDVTVTNGNIFNLSGDRRVEVWKIVENGGVCVKIYRPTKDGKTSLLRFGLSPEAAAALAQGIRNQLHGTSWGDKAT